MAVVAAEEEEKHTPNRMAGVGEVGAAVVEEWTKYFDMDGNAGEARLLWVSCAGVSYPFSSLYLILLPFCVLNK